MTSRRRIAYLAMGGTIDLVGSSRLDLAFYPDTGERLPDGQLLALIPELASIADIEQVPVERHSSHALTDADWLQLTRTVTELVGRTDVDGIVISHGTNTLEETAFFLDLTVSSPKPVVFVGAMRPSSGLGADGYLNLVRAVQVAAADAARDLGVLVVMNDTIFSARDVTKHATFRVDAFTAADLGPLGYADADGVVRIYHRPVGRPAGQFPFAVGDRSRLPRVDIVTTYIGADETFIEAAVRAGAKGIVSAATGAGRPSNAELSALERAAERGVTVCLSSRVGQGRVALSPRWSLPAVGADNLPPWKARTLLALALTRQSDLAGIQQLFDTV